MRSFQHKINEDIISRNELHTYNEKVLPKKNLNNKLLSLPLINNDICFTDRSPLNIHKTSLECLKPIEDKKIRTKIAPKGINNELKIKYLSFDREKKKNLFSLLKKKKIEDSNIKIQKNLLNDDLFKNNTSNLKDLILLNKYYNEVNKSKKIKTNLKKYQNLSNIPNKLRTISINEPNLSYNTTNVNNTIASSVKNRINEYNYKPYKKKIIKPNKEKNNDLIVHNIFFEWNHDKDNSNYFNNDYLNMVLNEDDDFNHSFDLLLNAYIKNQKIIKKFENKKVKSAGISRKTHNLIKIKFDFKDKKEILNKDKVMNKFTHNLNIINKENIDLKYLNPKALKKLKNIVSRNKSSNINNKYKTVNINIENIGEREKIYIDKKQILLLKKYNNNFAIRFLEKFFNRNQKQKEKLNFIDGEPSIINEYEESTDLNKTNSFKKNSLIQKNETMGKGREREIEKGNNIENNTYKESKINKSVKLNHKLNISNLKEKIKFKENGINENVDNEKEIHSILEYENKNEIKNPNYINSGKVVSKSIEKIKTGKQQSNNEFGKGSEKTKNEKKANIPPLNLVKENIDLKIGNQINENNENNNDTIDDYNDNNIIKSGDSLNKIEEKSPKNYSNVETLSNSLRQNKKDEIEISNNRNNFEKKNNLNPVNMTIDNRNTKDNIIKIKNNIMDTSQIDMKGNNKNEPTEITLIKNEKNYMKKNIDLKNTFNEKGKKGENSETINISKTNKIQNKRIKNYQINNGINEKVSKRNKNLKLNTFKTDNNTNISKNKEGEQNNSNINKNNKDISEYINDISKSVENEASKILNTDNKIKDENVSKPNDIVNDMVSSHKKNLNEDNFKSIENNFISSPKANKSKENYYMTSENNDESNKNNKTKKPYRRNSISNTSFKKESKFSEHKNNRRLSYINPIKASKRRMSVSNKSKYKNDVNNEKEKEEKNENFLLETPKDKLLLDEDEKDDSNNSQSKEFKENNNNEEKLDKEHIESPDKNGEENNDENYDSPEKYKNVNNKEDKVYEIEIIKVTKKKRKNMGNLDNLDSFLNSLKNIEEEFDKNKLLNISYNNILEEEDMKNLLLYSAKLRQFGELSESKKTEEIIQMEKDIREKYNGILNQFLVKQKYNDLLKRKGDFRKRRFRILYEEINENENEIEWVLKIKEEIVEKKHRRTRIGDNDEKKPKKLIYDNSYLFRKEKKDKNLVIKKEVLDILQAEYYPKMNYENKYEHDFMTNIIKRKKLNVKTSRIVKYIRKNKKNIKPIDKYKLSLFSDIKEEIVIEKKETEEDKKEKLFDEKMVLFEKEIERLRKSQKDFDYFEFLKHKEFNKNQNINRLINFLEDINNFRSKDKYNRAKFNFLDPIKFKTEN